jgi:hypothetical protein
MWLWWVLCGGEDGWLRVLGACEDTASRVEQVQMQVLLPFSFVVQE